MTTQSPTTNEGRYSGCSEIMEYLRQFPETSPEAYVLRHGTRFASLTGNRFRKGKAKRCFRNASLLADRQNLHYCEGYAETIYGAIHHAWCVDDAGDVYDPTWRETEGVIYFGVLIPRLVLARIICETGMYGVFDLMHWREKTILLKGLQS